VHPSASRPEAADFFISYTQADKTWAEWIAWQLEDAGYRVVLQAWDFSAGSNFIIEMDKAARTADCTVAVLSTEYMGSKFAAAEWSAALASDPTGESRRLLPVRIGGEPPTGLLATISWIDLTACDEASARSRLLAAAAGGRTKPSQRPAFPAAESQVMARPLFPVPSSIAQGTASKLIVAIVTAVSLYVAAAGWTRLQVEQVFDVPVEKSATDRVVMYKGLPVDEAYLRRLEAHEQGISVFPWAFKVPAIFIQVIACVAIAFVGGVVRLGYERLLGGGPRRMRLRPFVDAQRDWIRLGISGSFGLVAAVAASALPFAATRSGVTKYAVLTLLVSLIGGMLMESSMRARRDEP
jgi:hypothetical protein